jgi:lipopolysaccharide transport system ATP-binding protein
LSGRENVFLNGAILGMKRHEITRKFHEIVAFAELERFIDTPVKRYSSGMYVRLAFAVAAHLEPDVLVVDEVLAVGDAAFQERCVGKMHDIRRSGRALLVVSHNIQLVKQLCATAVMLEHGRLVAFDAIDKVLPQYFGASGQVEGEWQPSSKVEEPFSYTRVRIIPPPEYESHKIPAFLPFSIEFVFDVSAPTVSGRIALRIADSVGVVVMASANTDALSTFRKVWAAGAHREECAIPANLLVPGRYFLSISKPVDGGDVVLDNVCTFSIEAAGSLTERDGRLGVIAPMLSWSKH